MTPSIAIRVQGDYLKRLRPSIFLWINIVCLSIAFLSASPLFAKEVIVAIGDSITKGDTGWALLGHKNTIQGGWVTRLQTKLETDFPGEYQVINKGVNGDTAPGVLNRLNRDVILLEPGIVIVAIGTNDVRAVSQVSRPAGTTDEYRVTMEEIFGELKQKLPDTPVFVTGMTTLLKKYTNMSFGEWLTPFAQDVLEARFTEYNNILKGFAQKYEYTYVDVASEWPQDVEESWEFYADGIHPNDAGYDLMTEILYAALRSTVVHPIVSVEPADKLTATWATIKQGR